MFKCSVRTGGLAAVALLLGSCESMVLPDFEGGVLNPDIRFLRAGEVMNGVKCAMTEFLIEREQEIMAERVDTVVRRRESTFAEKRFLLLYGAEYSSDYSNTTANANLGRLGKDDHNGTQNELNPYGLHLDSISSHIDEIRESDVDPRGGGVLAGLCWPLTDGKYRHWDVDKKQCVINVPDKDTRGDELAGKGTCPQQIGVTIWDYKAKSKNGIPNSQCTTVPDYSRFALDQTQQASIDLTLTATNQGTVFYDYINPSGLGALKEIIAPGNHVTGAVFPKAEFTAKGMTIFEMSAQMPQTIFQAPGPDSPYEIPAAKSAKAIRKDRTFVAALGRRELASVSALEAKGVFATVNADGTLNKTGPTGKEKFASVTSQTREAILKDKKAKEYKLTFDALSQKLIADNEDAKKALNEAIGHDHQLVINKEKLIVQPKKGPTGKPPLDVLSSREITLIRDELTPGKQFASGCGGHGIMKVDDTTEIDYLKLKEMLHNVVARQNEQVSYHGGPEVALDTLTLTSSFELILDLSAGTKHIFRFFPMVLPPQMGIRPDHTHSLKITLHGAKKKGDPQSGKNLVLACQQRLQLSKEDGGICEQAQAKLLEAIIEVTEQNKASGTSSSTGQ